MTLEGLIREYLRNNDHAWFLREVNKLRPKPTEQAVWNTYHEVVHE